MKLDLTGMTVADASEASVVFESIAREVEAGKAPPPPEGMTEARFIELLREFARATGQA